MTAPEGQRPAEPVARAAAPAPVVLTVMRREMLVRLRSRVFLGGTAVMVALVVVGIVVASLVIGRTTSVKVGFTAESAPLQQDFIASATAVGQQVTVSTVADEATGRSQVSAGTLDALVTGPPTSPTIVVKQSAPATMQAALQRAVLSARFTALGIPAGVLATVTSGLQVPVDALQPTNPQAMQDRIVGLAVGILLFLVLGLYGSQVAQGVVEEKATRIMEILLATVRPTRLLAGKIVGIGIVGLMQIGIVAAATLVAVAVTNVVTTPALSPTAIVAYLVWFVLGFLMYSAGYAALASLVSRPEEVQGAIGPMALFPIASYLLAYLALANPTSPVVTVASLLPPFAPILMAVRMSGGDVPPWQVALALALTVAAIVGLTWLAGRIYANSAMRIGAKVRFIDAFRG
jgi:ABC-2 type transport system permease protein